MPQRFSSISGTVTYDVARLVLPQVRGWTVHTNGSFLENPNHGVQPPIAVEFRPQALRPLGSRDCAIGD